MYGLPKSSRPPRRKTTNKAPLRGTKFMYEPVHKEMKNYFLEIKYNFLLIMLLQPFTQKNSPLQCPFVHQMVKIIHGE